jgi:hypothetical protein
MTKQTKYTTMLAMLNVGYCPSCPPARLRETTKLNSIRKNNSVSSFLLLQQQQQQVQWKQHISPPYQLVKHSADIVSAFLSISAQQLATEGVQKIEAIDAD